MQTADRLVSLRSVGISWLITDLPIAAVGSVAAFALDARGGVGVFLPTTGFFFVIVLALWVGSIRGLGDGTGVRRVPPGAEVRTSDIGRRVLIRLPLMAAGVGGLVLALGTYGAGMALGSILTTAIWLPLLARWEAKRGLTVYRPVRTPWRRSKGSLAGYYVQPSSVGGGNR